MIRSILASALLFASASFASAEYVIIIANVGTGNELNAQPGPGVGGPGGARGAPGGGGAGIRGMAPGAPGVGRGFGNQGGLRPGMVGGANGMAGGMRGMGGPGGMRGMGGPGGMRGMGGLGGMAQAPEIDDIPEFIIAVVEVNPVDPKIDIHKSLTNERLPEVMRSVRVKHQWGASTLLAKTDFAETIVLTKDSDRKSLKSVGHQFDEEFKKKITDAKPKPTVSDILELADWTLAHGLVDKFPQVMDKLVEIDKSNPAAVAYLKVKADIDRPVKTDESGAWRGKLLPKYKVTDGPHYTIVHHHSSSTPTIAPRMKLLENSLRGFYYWFALKGVAQPVPNHRQVVVVTDQPKDFQHLQEILTSGPVVVDGFFARRENLAVMASQRQDETYDSLKKFWKRWEDRNFNATGLLSGKSKAGYPSGAANLDQVHVAQMVALMVKALEQEGQRATISHDASRQLLFASGLLPRNVAAPEWLLFGMGSFFETPLWSPWSSFAAPNAYYLPRWKELKGKGFETKPGDMLRKVVSDVYFRALPPEGKADSAERHAYDAALRKARTTSWSLTYFLAKQKLDGLQRYFKELSKMPRDLELDDEVLLGCFMRAFGLDDSGLIALEREWFSYLGNVKFASESTMRKIQTIFKDKLAQMQQAQNAGNGGQPQIDPRTGQPFQPGGVNPQRPANQGGIGPQGRNPRRN